MSNAAAPPHIPSEIELQQIEEMFDKADDFMINQSNHTDAVSWLSISRSMIYLDTHLSRDFEDWSRQYWRSEQSCTVHKSHSNHKRIQLGGSVILEGLELRLRRLWD